MGISMKQVIVPGANGHTAREIIPRLLEQDDVELPLFVRNANLGRFIADLVKHPEPHVNEDLGISQPHTDGDWPAAYR